MTTIQEKHAHTLISVIIPVYGVESAIQRTIESVIAQDFRDWELILVDDGSPDKSDEICDRYAREDARITVIHQQNQGVSAARNRGLSVARGRYINFIDGDDYVAVDYLSSMLRYAEESDAVYGNVTHLYPAESRETIAFDYPDGLKINLDTDVNDIVKYRIPENGFPVAKLYRRDIIEANNLRFDTRLSYHEDHLFVLSYLSHCKNITLSSSPSYYYIHLPSATSLSKRRHSAEKLILAAESLLPAVKQFISRTGIRSADYIARLHTVLGLNQILMGIRNRDHKELPVIAEAVRRHRSDYLHHYRPNHLSARILPHLFLLHFTPLLRLLPHR